MKRLTGYAPPLAILAAVLLAALPARADAVFILDASSSMWAQIGGVNKTVMAREALKRALTAQEGRLQAGVIAFGSAKAAGCDDIQTIKPVGAVDASYGAAIDAVKPKGAGPLAAALEKAGALSETGPPPSTIVILADGADNCKADPCAAAANLKQNNPSLKIHMIALDAKAKEALSALACVANATGGLFLPASNEAELDAAMQQAAAAAASARPAGSALRPGRASQVALPLPDALTGASGDAGAAPQRSSPPPRFGAPGNVSLAAHLSEGAPAIDSGVLWRIFEGAASAEGGYKLVKSVSDARPDIALPPGEYLINASYGRANLTKKVAIWPGQTGRDDFILNAGGLRLGAILTNGQPVAENLVKFEILSEASDQFGNRERVIDAVRPGAVIRLNSGYYHVVSLYGDANGRIESDVIVEPGRLTEALVKHDAAKAAFRLVRKAGGEALADTKWAIQTASGEMVKETAGAFPSHILAAGAYRVVATHEDRDYAKPFTMAPGEAQQIEVIIPE